MSQLPLTFTADTPQSASLEARPGCLEAARHRADLLNLFRSGAELTADEAGNRVGLGPLSARPRVSELARKYGLLEPSAERSGQPRHGLEDPPADIGSRKR